MQKLAVAILLSLPGLAYAQLSQVNESSQVSVVSTSDAGLDSSAAAQDANSSAPQTPPPTSRRGYFGRDMIFGQPAMGPHESPVGSFTAGYIYTFTDSQTGHNRSLMGWSAVPEVRLYRTIGLQADFTGLYVRSVYPGENRFLAAAGPRYTFAPRSRFTPFIYAEGGEMRSTTQANNSSDWNPIVKGGIGFEHKVSHGIALQLIPGEYFGEQLDDHSWQHSFSARAGITFNLYK